MRPSHSLGLALGSVIVGLFMVAPNTAPAAGKKAAARAAPAPAPPAAPDPAEVIDASAFRAKLAVYTDGEGHYLAAPPDLSDDAVRGMLYWSPDGKTFWAQRVPSFGGSGTESFDLTFWEPRIRDGWRRSFGRKGAVATLQCDERETTFQALPAEQAKPMLEAATFLKARWKHMAYALARNDEGVYFFVDRKREPPDSKAFRLYMGKKGELKPLKMVNVVSDSEGDIFATKSGELRLIIPKGGSGADVEHKEPTWIKGKKKTALTWVPVEDNAYMIYVELGVYAGQLLGTPCDDL
jgi:hypothetical protein